MDSNLPTQWRNSTRTIQRIPTRTPKRRKNKKKMIPQKAESKKNNQT